MRLVRVLLVGAAAGIVCGVLTLIVELGLLMMKVARLADESGSAGLVSHTPVAPYVALAAFLVGALWQYRRS
jgi:hypothetical protein